MNLPTIQLYDHQQNLKQNIYNSWNEGARNVCAVLPTGGGKSVVTSDIILDGVNQQLSQCVIAHRNELVTQMSGHIAARGIYHRIIGSDKTVKQAIRQHRAKYGHSFVNPSAPTSVVGVDTMMARKASLRSWAEQQDRWVIDEFHHTIGNDRITPNKWGKAVQMLRNAQGLGVTATPCRADGQGLGREYDGVADSLILGPSMRFLIRNGFLSDYEIVCPKSDMQVHEEQLSTNGDWSSQTLKKVAKESHIVGDVATSYVTYAYGRKAICFAPDVESSIEIARRIREFGVPAASLDGKTPDAVREKYIEEFRTGKIWVLVNVDLFDEGFDVPDCEVCIMARPTASLGKYRQQVGRALRYVPNKLALIIDLVSNVVRHGLPDREILWTLARRDKRSKSQPDPDDIPLTECTNCSRPYEAFRTECPHCGHVKSIPEPKDRTIKVIEGDLILLDKETLERMRQATQPEAPADIANRVARATNNPIAGKAAANRQIEKIEQHEKLRNALEQWAGVEREKGFNDREIARKFYMTTGVDVLSALDAKHTRKEMETLTTRIEGWYT